MVTLRGCSATAYGASSIVSVSRAARVVGGPR